jgi:predicted amidohydrolase
MYAEAVKQSVELLIFPHLMIDGLRIDPKDVGDPERFRVLKEIISLTHKEECAILVGGVFAKLEGILLEVYDSGMFIRKNEMERVITRKTIDKSNILIDNRVFEKGYFLDFFEYKEKRFIVLLSDDIFHNFNIILSSEQNPNYIVCLDSSQHNGNDRIKHLKKLAKFANCPVFYLNSANYFSDDLQFNGDIVLINEDFEVVLETFYKEDRLIVFDINNEDGTEILMKNPPKDRITWIKKGDGYFRSPMQNINVLKKRYEDDDWVINCADYCPEELRKIKKNIKRHRFVKFSDDGEDYQELDGIIEANVGDFYRENFFERLLKDDRKILREIVLRNI